MTVTIDILLPGGKEFLRIQVVATKTANVGVYTIHTMGSGRAVRALLESELKQFGIGNITVN